MSDSGLFTSLPVWFANGCLAVLYWLAAHLAEGIALACGVWIAFHLDPRLQGRAGERPRRYDRGRLQTAAPAASAFTLLTLLTWLCASLFSRYPLPWIGAVLWLAGSLSLLVVTEERMNQAWWVKGGLLTYAALVLLLRFGLPALQGAHPGDWSTVLGSSAEAGLALAQTRSNVAVIGLLFVWVIYPLGFLGGLINRSLRNPKPLFNLWLEAGEVLKRLRTRQ